MKIKSIKLNSIYPSVNIEFNNIKNTIDYLKKGDIPAPVKENVNKIQSLIERIDFDPESLRDEIISIVDADNLSIENFTDELISALKKIHQINIDSLSTNDYNVIKQINKELKNMISPNNYDFINKIEITYTHKNTDNKLVMDSFNNSTYIKIIKELENDYKKFSLKFTDKDFNDFFNKYLFEKYRKDFLLNESILHLITNDKSFTINSYINNISKNGEDSLKIHHKLTDSFIYIKPELKAKYELEIKKTKNSYEIIDDMDFPLIFPKNETSVKLINDIKHNLLQKQLEQKNKNQYQRD